jgi:hypothetical protein
MDDYPPNTNNSGARPNTNSGDGGDGKRPNTGWAGEVTTGQGFAGLAYLLATSLSGGGMSKQQIFGLLAATGVSLLWQEGKTNANILDLIKRASPRAVVAMIMLLLVMAGAGNSLSSVLNSAAPTDNTRPVAQIVPVVSR